MAIAVLSGWASEQKHVVAASFLGWSLDAFDFFSSGVRAERYRCGIPDRYFKRHDCHPLDVGNASHRSLHFRPRRGPVGAICGGILFGTLSERFGRRRCIIIAALLSLPVIPLWAFSDSPALLAIGRS